MTVPISEITASSRSAGPYAVTTGPDRALAWLVPDERPAPGAGR